MKTDGVTLIAKHALTVMGLMAFHDFISLFLSDILKRLCSLRYLHFSICLAFKLEFHVQSSVFVTQSPPGGPELPLKFLFMAGEDTCF